MTVIDDRNRNGRSDDTDRTLVKVSLRQRRRLQGRGEQGAEGDRLLVVVGVKILAAPPSAAPSSRTLRRSPGGRCSYPRGDECGASFNEASLVLRASERSTRICNGATLGTWSRARCASARGANSRAYEKRAEAINRDRARDGAARRRRAARRGRRAARARPRRRVARRPAARGVRADPRGRRAARSASATTTCS